MYVYTASQKFLDNKYIFRKYFLDCISVNPSMKIFILQSEFLKMFILNVVDHNVEQNNKVSNNKLHYILCPKIFYWQRIYIKFSKTSPISLKYIIINTKINTII